MTSWRRWRPCSGGYLGLLMPEVEQQLEKLPDKESASRYCALACLGDARYRLRGQPHHRCDSPLAHARCLARAVNALCNHYESLHDALSKTPA
jgi:hypothetical protein